MFKSAGEQFLSAGHGDDSRDGKGESVERNSLEGVVLEQPSYINRLFFRVSICHYATMDELHT